MFCSVIIPTIGRSSLSRTVESALNQELDASEFEVIIVNDSGKPLSLDSRMHAGRIRILDTNRRERSCARNAGAATAVGDYLYFLDDDDWLLPGGLGALHELAQRSPKAVWLHGGVRVVDELGRCLAERNSGLKGDCLAQVVGGAWAPIQSSLIRSQDFFAAGGFDPFIRGTEDQDLCRRIAVRGAFANTPTTVACLFRGSGWKTSTDYARATEDTRISRDIVTDHPGAFRLMTDSANDPYWRGRVVHVYSSLALWNWRRRRFVAAIGCAGRAACATALSGTGVATRDFWKALRADHVPGSLHFIQLASESEAAGRPELP